jgi:phage pi2 protein 07
MMEKFNTTNNNIIGGDFNCNIYQEYWLTNILDIQIPAQRILTNTSVILVDGIRTPIKSHKYNRYHVYFQTIKMLSIITPHYFIMVIGSPQRQQFFVDQIYADRIVERIIASCQAGQLLPIVEELDEELDEVVDVQPHPTLQQQLALAQYGGEVQHHQQQHLQWRFQLRHISRMLTNILDICRS